MDVREQLARIDRMIDDGAKVRAEAMRLEFEALKQRAEAYDLDAYASPSQELLAPLLAAGLLAGMVGGTVVTLLQGCGIP